MFHRTQCRCSQGVVHLLGDIVGSTSECFSVLLIYMNLSTEKRIMLLFFFLIKTCVHLLFCVLKVERFMSAAWISKSIGTFNHIRKLSSKNCD